MSTISNKIHIKGKRKSSVKYAKHQKAGPEIKKSNFFFDPAIEGNSLRSSCLIVPYRDNIPGTRNDMFPCYSINWMRTFGIGDQSYQRIGSRIRVKYIQIKGYCQVYQNLLSQCRVRLSFIREMNTATEHRFSDFWANLETLHPDATAAEQCATMRHNYYKSQLDSHVMNSDLTCQKILELNLTPYVSPSASYFIQGGGATTSASWGAGVELTPVHQEAYCIPINKVLVLNEDFNFGSDNYGIIAECDQPFAGTATELPLVNKYPTLTKAQNTFPFMLNFFVLVYYTDA